MRPRSWTALAALVLLAATLATQAGCATTPSPTGSPSPTEMPTATVSATATVATLAPTPTHTPASTSVNPVVVLSPTSGPPGTQVEVVASGFRPNTTVQVSLGPINGEPTPVATIQADTDGHMAVPATIPEVAVEDERWVVTVTIVGQPVTATSNLFEVTMPLAQPSPTPASLPSGQAVQVRIYLIAIGDNGQSGSAVGCGDSVVPVTIEIQKTVAPLTAALNRLLGLKDQYYGESGLYDALYQSDLRIAGINIVQGTATISLTGTLTLAGECDDPRVKAQLEETALQFSTVQRVVILLNGQPLEGYLGGQ